MGRIPDENNLSRRELLAGAGALAAARTIAAQTGTPETGNPPHAEATATRPSPAERVGIGLIGTGGMGQVLLQEFLTAPDVNIVALVDCHDRNREIALRTSAAKGHHPADYRDYRKLLDHPDVDAVVIATPDHWHALPTVHACQAGKDVYIETPLSYSIAEGRAMLQAARRANRITQFGTHNHASENFRRVVEIAQSGMLGQISKVRIWSARNEAPNGHGSPDDTAPPPDVDYDLWLGPAPKRPFNPLRFHFHFRWFWDYAGGHLTDVSCHLLDLVYWALKLDAPRTIVASGGRYACQDICETPDTLEVTWEYPATAERKIPLQLVWSLTAGNSRGIEEHGQGVAFYGTSATLVADYERYEIFAEGERLKGIDKPKPSIRPSPGHRREFIDSVKSRKPCSCPIDYAHRLTIAPLMGNIAFRTGLKLAWDPKKEQFPGASAANKLLSREYRAPWTLPT